MRYAVVLTTALLFLNICMGDTFTHQDTKETFDGYATSVKIGNKTKVVTPDGEKAVDMMDYEVEYNYKGRNPVIPVLSIPDAIMIQMEIRAFNEELQKEADKGPYFILIKIDSPGGRVDYCEEICNAILELDYCKTVAYISGGKKGGAYSAAAIISIACDEIYMASGTVIGAATMIAGGDDIEKILGENTAEKFRSAWRTKTASIAEKTGRPPILVKAMENKEIEVVEVKIDGERKFIDSVNYKPEYEKVKIWSKKGFLLTLTANEAQQCGISDGQAESDRELIALLKADDVKLKPNTEPDDAREYYQRVEAKFKKLDNALENGFSSLGMTQSYRTALSTTRELIRDAKMMLMLKRKFEGDIPYEEDQLEELIEDLNSFYTNLKRR